MKKKQQWKQSRYAEIRAINVKQQNKQNKMENEAKQTKQNHTLPI